MDDSWINFWRNGPNWAVRKGDWKLLWLHKPMGISDWELFDLSKDPGETRDLAAEHPALVERMRVIMKLHEEVRESTRKKHEDALREIFGPEKKPPAKKDE